jgi:hypothetical protein
VWDASNLAAGPLAMGSGHTSYVRSVAYSPDGSRIVSGSDDNTVRVWDASNLAAGPLATGSGHTGSVRSVAYSPDSSRIVSGSYDNTVRVWRLTFANRLELTAVNVTSCHAATAGGAISAKGSDLVHHWSFEAHGSSFYSNAATVEGGALALTGSNAHVDAFTAKLVGCRFHSNAVPLGRGGALAASDSRFEVSSSTFWLNEGRSGSAIYYGGSSASAAHLPTIQAASFLGNAPGPTVQADALIDWICFPGQYMLQAGPATGNFDGCYPCSAGYFGTAPNHTSPLCEAACQPGRFCLEGSTEPQSCPAGTYLPTPGAATNASCIPCAPGSSSAISGNGDQSCTPCTPGNFSEKAGSLSCEACPSGKRADDSGAVCINCVPGKFAANGGSPACGACSAGTFSSTPGATECDSCEPGGFCASVGAASASMTFEQCPGAFCTLHTRDPPPSARADPPYPHAWQPASTIRTLARVATHRAARARLARPTPFLAAATHLCALTASQGASPTQRAGARAPDAHPALIRTPLVQPRASTAVQATTASRARAPHCRVARAHARTCR